MEDRADAAARLVAEACGRLSVPELQFCFRTLFEIPAECRLFDRFRVAYETERDRTEGLRRNQRLAAVLHLCIKMLG